MTPMARATATLYLGVALPALLVALVPALLVGGLWGPHGGDALLWEAGGFPLLETARLLAPTALALGRAVPWALLAWMILGLLPQAMALAFLAPGERSPLEQATLALRSLPALFFVLSVTVLARVIALLLCILFAKGLTPGLAGLSDPVRALVHLPIVLLAFLLLTLLRVLQDLTGTAVVLRGERGRDALLTGLEILHRHPFSSVGAWARWALLGFGIAVAAWWLGSRWHAGAGLGLAALIHQVGLVGISWTRARWLKRTMSILESKSNL
ncbi:MAG: hypothetical protein RMJ98_16745 [Myxococcales bacterium]|nr:hypothetical protein [Polyangiaceae bacterium]MDW8250944.1 hypothetical protein [Myxococcales bacterium]